MTKYKNIFLVGFMGAGKTSVGRILAERLELGFVDLDEAIEKKLGMTVPQIFSDFGEGFFRDTESEVLRSVAQTERGVVATGGGVVLRDENWKAMRGEGLTIYLKAPAEVLWNRVKGNRSRPLLRVENPYERLFELLSKRIHLYEKADLTIDTENLSPQSVVEEIMKSLKNFKL